MAFIDPRLKGSSVSRRILWRDPPAAQRLSEVFAHKVLRVP